MIDRLYNYTGPHVLQHGRDRLILLVLLLSSVCASVCLAEPWPRFRGPNGAGAASQPAPVQWSKNDYNWICPLPGRGHSSPAIWGDSAFIQSADQRTGTQYLLCIETGTGKVRWKHEFAANTYHTHARNSFASSSPAADARHVYFTWATPDRLHVVAYDHAGKQQWARHDLGSFPSQHGWGSSPMVVGDLLIVCNLQRPSDPDNLETSSIFALSCADGSTKWQTPRDSGKASYSVPCVRQRANGIQELVCCSTANGLFALDLSTGRENWAAPVFSMRTVSSPQLVGDWVLGTTGSGRGGNYVVVVDPSTSEEIYRIRRQAPYVPTPLVHEGWLYLWSDKGVLSCVNAKTGKTNWIHRVGGNYSGSPICVGGNLYCIGEDGTVVVVAADPKRCRLISKQPLGEDSRATPAASDGVLYLRTESMLFSVGTATAGTTP